MSQVLDINTFSSITKYIEKITETYKIGYIDAVIHYCEENNLEVEFLGELINQNPNLKAKIELEAEELHYLKKTDRLPL